MRISDWSSDVCSSDLAGRRVDRNQVHQRLAQRLVDAGLPVPGVEQRLVGDAPTAAMAAGLHAVALADHHGNAEAHQRADVGGALRSEEHTSELQSLMRISYAVFCLKKKNNDASL